MTHPTGNGIDTELGLVIEQAAIDPAASTEELGEVTRNFDYYLARLVASLVLGNRPFQERLIVLLFGSDGFGQRFDERVRQVVSNTPRETQVTHVHHVEVDNLEPMYEGRHTGSPWPAIVLGAIIGLLTGVIVMFLVNAGLAEVFFEDGFRRALVSDTVDEWGFMIPFVTCTTLTGTAFGALCWALWGNKTPIVVGWREPATSTERRPVRPSS